MPENGMIKVAENGGIPCDLNGLQVFLTNTAKSTSSGEGEGQIAEGRLVAMMPNSQEGHRVAKRVSNSHEGSGSDQESAKWFKACSESCQMFCALFLSFIFGPFIAFFGHFMPF